MPAPQPPMLARLLLLAALALPALGCDHDAEPPLGRDPAAPAEMPTPGAPENLETEEAEDARAVLPGEPPASPSVILPPNDDAPPAPVAILGVVGSCDARSTEPLCFAFTGTGWTATAAQAECASAEGAVFQSALCPTENRIGECVYRPDGDAAREIVYTFYAPMEPLIAEAVCRGTFRAL